MSSCSYSANRFDGVKYTERTYVTSASYIYPLVGLCDVHNQSAFYSLYETSLHCVTKSSADNLVRRLPETVTAHEGNFQHLRLLILDKRGRRVFGVKIRSSEHGLMISGENLEIFLWKLSINHLQANSICAWVTGTLLKYLCRFGAKLERWPCMIGSWLTDRPDRQTEPGICIRVKL